MSFPLKENERYYPNYVLNRTQPYVRAMGFIETFFTDAAYSFKQNIGCLRISPLSGKRRIHVVANFVARRKGDKEVAGILNFPKHKSVPTRKVLDRLIRLEECFPQIGVFLIGTDQSFPVISDRINKTFPNALIYLLDLDKGRIREAYKRY